MEVQKKGKIKKIKNPIHFVHGKNGGVVSEVRNPRGDRFGGNGSRCGSVELVSGISLEGFGVKPQAWVTAGKDTGV